MDEMVTCIREYYLNKIPYIVKCKLREFDENNLSRHAVPTLAFFTKRFLTFQKALKMKSSKNIFKLLKKSVSCAFLSQIGQFLVKDGILERKHELPLYILFVQQIRMMLTNSRPYAII